MLCELTHRCPLQCPYCSNPVELDRPAGELTTDEWRHVLAQAAALGVLQVHLSGGEPTLRRDLEEIVRAAVEAGLYTNLITAGVHVDRARLKALLDDGIDHVQLSQLRTDAATADRIDGMPGGFERKMAFAQAVAEEGVPLTVNAVMHRQNLAQLPEMLEIALRFKAHRIEVAHVQYYGWALKNRSALMPTRAQMDKATEQVRQARERLKGRLQIDYVVPDYYASRPKPCMGGWGRSFLNVTPVGDVLPCHAAQTIPGLGFDNVRDKSLKEIWETSSAFQTYRGTGWMKEPCRTCPEREKDWGGCRCQALMMTGDAANADPVCALSPFHHLMEDTAAGESERHDDAFTPRRFARTEA
jgi:pyrroloquinoline quinone biosynthesis protein E